MATVLDKVHAWLDSSPNAHNLPKTREALIEKLSEFCAESLVSREDVKKGLLDSRMVAVEQSKILYNPSVSIDKVIKALGENASSGVRPIAEKVARYIRGSGEQDLPANEDEFNALIDSWGPKVSYQTILRDLIGDGLVEVRPDNSVYYPHLQHANESTTTTSPLKTSHDGGDNNRPTKKHRLEMDYGYDYGPTSNASFTIGYPVEIRGTIASEETEASEYEDSEAAKVGLVEILDERFSNYTFQDIEFHNRMLTTLRNNGIEKCTHIQAKLIPQIIVGNNVLCQSPAGSGKTTGYVLSLVQRVDTTYSKVQILIVTPSRTEASKVSEILSSYGNTMGVKFYCCNDDPTEVQRDKAHIVVGSSARIEGALVRNKTLTLKNVKTVVFHDVNHLFTESAYPLTTMILRNCAGIPQVIGTCDTLDPAVATRISNFRNTFLTSDFTYFLPHKPASTHLAQGDIHTLSPYVREHIFTSSKSVGLDADINELLRVMREEPAVVGRKVIIVVRTQVELETAQMELVKTGFNSVSIKAHMLKHQSSDIIANFRSQEDIKALVVQGSIDLGDLTTQVLINFLEGQAEKYPDRTRVCGTEGETGVIINIVPFGLRDKVRELIREPWGI